MFVTVSVYGRFHAFYLAYQLYARGYLQRLITSYPKFEVEKYGIPRDSIYSLILNEFLKRGSQKLPSLIYNRVDSRFWLNHQFDIAAAHHIPEDSDLFVGWSGFSENQLKRAKQLGQITILERGSSHIEFQRDILKEEYERFGLPVRLPHRQVVVQEKHEYELADYIAVPSTFAYRSFIEKGFEPNKLIKTSYGVDLQQFRQVPKEDDVFRVVFAGNMTLQKGVHYLLEAFSKLNLPNAELWLLGKKTPESESFFEKYEGHYRYIGHVPQSELHKYYSQCSVFAIMSVQEGMAMVQPQAMACGLPLICTTNTGGEDLIENGKEGFIIPIRSVPSLMEKILFLYEHPEICFEMGQSAKHKVKTGFTWNDYGKNIIDVYEQLIRKKSDNASG